MRAGQRAGEIPAEHDPEVLAAALHNGWIGVRIQARAGRTPEQIAAMIDGLMATLA